MLDTIYKIPNAPRLALLGDLHNHPYSDILGSLRAHRPEAIMIAGDIIYGSHPEDDRSPLDTQVYILPFLAECAALVPTFLSLGNHEWMLDEADLDKIRSTGVTILDNCWTKKGNLVIGGLTSAYVLDYRRFVADLPAFERSKARYPKRKPEAKKHRALTPDTSWLPAFCSIPGYHVLLSHHPENWPLLSPYPLQLCLSAHAHGGQWRIFGKGIWAPGQGFLPRWTSGIHDGRFIISRGLSNTTRIPRIHNEPEVVYIGPE